MNTFGFTRKFDSNLTVICYKVLVSIKIFREQNKHRISIKKLNENLKLDNINTVQELQARKLILVDKDKIKLTSLGRKLFRKFRKLFQEIEEYPRTWFLV